MSKEVRDGHAEKRAGRTPAADPLRASAGSGSSGLFIGKDARPQFTPDLAESLLPSPDSAPSDIQAHALRVLGGRGARPGASAPEFLESLSRYEISPAAAWALLDSEVVILDLASGAYFTLNRTGALLWNALAGRCSKVDVLRRACAAGNMPEAEVRRDFLEILQQLRDSGLIRIKEDHHD